MKQKEQHDSKVRERSLEVGDRVFVRNYHQGDKWLPGVIHKKTGPLSFLAKLADGRYRRCHQDQVRKRSVGLSADPPVEPEVSVPSTGFSVPPLISAEPSALTQEKNDELPMVVDPTPSGGDTASTTSPEKLTPNVLVLLLFGSNLHGNF